MGRTLAEKVWDEHVVRSTEGEPDLLYIDLHLIHEVTSPQAFDGLRLAGRPVRRPDLTLATEDHNVPTIDWDQPIKDPVSRTQVETLRRNCEEFGVRLHPLGDRRAGHRPRRRPAARAHPARHDDRLRRLPHLHPRRVRRARLRHRHVARSSTCSPPRPCRRPSRRRWPSTSPASLPDGVTAKDLVLTLIAHTGTGGGQGYVVEYRGPAIEALSMEGRMTVCNMSIEWGAKAGLIAPDADHVRLPRGPSRGADGRRLGRRRRALADAGHRRRRRSSTREIEIDASTMTPFVTWGTNPGQGVPLGASVPDPESFDEESDRVAARKALEYMGLEGGTPMRDIHVDTVFVGSCTNGRIEDLRLAAEILEGHTVAADTRLLVVPGSVRVRLQAEEEGLDVVFKEAGAEWRGAGCSMCLGMNPDQLAPQERSASTSNRNFEGRQGKGGRTHLVSVPVAAATAVRGTLSSPADLEPSSVEPVETTTAGEQ